MKYTVSITTTDANGTTTTTITTTTATDAKSAHANAAANAADGAKIRVYPSTLSTVGIMCGAVMVARRTAINAIQRQGTPTQHRIEREFAAINARLVGAESPERISAVMLDYSTDTQDFYSVALLGLQDAKAAGLPIDEQYHAAYMALNRFIHSQRAATDYELSTEFLQDGGGDIVSVNAAIACIIRGGEKWTPTDGGNMDGETAARLGKAIADAMRIISPTQRRIAELLGRGYSQRQIAAAMGRNIETVEKNIAIMRGKIAEYIRDNSPEFTDLIRHAETAAAKMAQRDAENRRTADGAARHNKESNRKRTADGKERENARKAADVASGKAAERMRKLRARKAAERQAAKQNG